jgi:hypothetical protein
MSKTVKRVPETVKKVTRVMMVGLIAMLGAKAEAHWYVAGGTPKRCSHCVDAELTDRDEKHDFEHTEEADFHLTAKTVRLLCQTTDNGVSTLDLTNRSVDLAVQKRIVPPGDVTYRSIDSGRSPEGPATFDLTAKFSDLLLKEDPDLLCVGTGLLRLPPIDVLILNTSLTIVTYACKPGAVCEVLSRFERGSCTLRNSVNFTNNYPPIGTPYVCLR